MRTIQHRFPWTDKTDWAWPDHDVKLLQVINDVNDVDTILDKYVPERRVAWQAGAACGIWPFRLALLFDNVITVEPLNDNFACAAQNLLSVYNVRFFQGVLGSGKEGRRVSMKQHPREQNNAGSQQVELIHPEADILNMDTFPVFTIDELTSSEDHVDFMALDLEGYELMAVQGAAEVIDRCNPVIVVEDKGLSSKFGVAQGTVIQHLIKRHDYKVVENIKRDVVMCHRSQVERQDIENMGVK